jgi:anthraniloyl-CoA monooxygenase
VVVSELVAVAPDGRVTPGTPGLWEEAHAQGWARVAAAARRQGTRLALRLGHAGRRGATRPRRHGVDRPLPGGGWPLLAASAIPYGRGSATPRAMRRADMKRVTGEFARAARLAAAAGADVLLLDLAHGYLLGGFLSPLANRRDDRYGGALEDRLRFPLEVVDAVRAAWPAERPLWAALAASDWEPGGIEPQEAVAAARALAGRGCELVQVTAGQATAGSRPDYGRFFLVGWSDLVRNEAGVATMVGGNLTTADEVDTIVCAGRADLCVLDPPERQ